MADKVNKEKMDAFVTFFNTKIFPAVMEKEGQGLARLKEIVKRRRQAVEERNNRRSK